MRAFSREGLKGGAHYHVTRSGGYYAAHVPNQGHDMQAAPTLDRVP